MPRNNPTAAQRARRLKKQGHVGVYTDLLHAQTTPLDPDETARAAAR